MGPYGADDCKEGSSGLDQGGAVLGVDAADCDAGEFHEFGPPGDEFGLCPGGRFLRGGGEEGAEGHVVRAILAGLHGEVSAVVAGDAEGEGWADKGACFAGRGIGLADVDAVGAGLQDKVGAVVEEEGDAARLGDREKGVDGAAPVVVVGFLEAKLDGGDVACVEGASEGLGEVGAGCGGGDEVEFAVGHQGFIQCGCGFERRRLAQDDRGRPGAVGCGLADGGVAVTLEPGFEAAECAGVVKVQGWGALGENEGAVGALEDGGVGGAWVENDDAAAEV